MCDDGNWAPLVNLKGRGGSIEPWVVIGRWTASENSRMITSEPERGWSADREATLLVPHSSFFKAPKEEEYPILTDPATRQHGHAVASFLRAEDGRVRDRH